MIRNFNRYTLIFMLCCLGLCFQATAQEVQAVAKLEQNAIRIGDQTKLHLSVYQRLKQKVNFPLLNDTLNSAIQILSSSKPDTIRDKNDPDKIIVTKSLVITSFDAGTYTIPGFIFESTVGSLKSNVLRLIVQSVKVDTTKSIYDIKGPLAVSYTFTDWLKDNWRLVSLSFLCLLLLAFLLYNWNKRRKNKAVRVVLQPLVPAHTIALNQLNLLKNKELWQKNLVKEYYSELTDVLREYLEKRYPVKTQEKTTDEIISSLNKLEIPFDNREMLHQLLLLADLVKFAKGKPSASENEKSIVDAMLFVSSTAERKSERLTEGNGTKNTTGNDGNI